MLIVRQSTARTVTVGPVLDSSGAAVTTAVVGDFKISKNGGAPAALNGSATITHRNTGHYSLALTATDCDTVGQAEIVIDATTNACPVKELTVVEEAVYDALFAASAAGYGTLDAAGVRSAVGLASANLDTQIGTLATAANLATVAGYLDTEIAAILADTDALEQRLTATRAGYLDAAISSRSTLAATDIVSGGAITTSGGRAAATVSAYATGLDPATLLYQNPGELIDTEAVNALCTDYWSNGVLNADLSGKVIGGGTGTITGVGAWAAGAAGAAVSTLDAAGVRTAVGLASANLDTQIGDIPTVAEFNARTIAAADYATATNLATVDTVVDAIKLKTDQLAFTVAGQVDANVESINAAAVNGNGTTGNKWRGA